MVPTLVLTPSATVPWSGGAHHVQVDVHDAACQVLAALHRRRVIPVLPKCPEALLAPIVCLARASFEDPHARRHLVPPPIAHHEMDEIAGDDVIQHAQAVRDACLVEPPGPPPPVAPESEQELENWRR
jgi:hypothetical protein